MLGTVDQGLLEDAVPTEINKHYYKINFLGDEDNYVIRLTEEGVLPDNTNLTIRYGTEYIGRKFVKNSYSDIILIPNLTASLDTLYYQDGSNSEKVGLIRLIDGVSTDIIDVSQILGKKVYTSPNDIKFTNGLKVQFSGNVFPEIYAQGQYYVEGVGASIQLLPVDNFDIPEPFGTPYTSPFDGEPFDSFPWGETLFYPLSPDYITIARNSFNKNAWSRSNRWFHVDVLNTVIEKSLVSPISTEALGNPDKRAKRPIIEFYPNLKLYQSGTVAKPNTSFINFSATDAFNEVAGQPNFKPDGVNSVLYDGATIIFAGDTDVEVRNKIWTCNFITLSGVTSTVTFSSKTGSGPYIVTLNIPTQLTPPALGVTYTVSGNSNELYNGNYVAVGSSLNTVTLEYDTNPGVFSNSQPTLIQPAPVISLAKADDGDVSYNEQTVITQGYVYQGKSFYFDGTNWIQAQFKERVNQPPLFDIFDSNSISFGDRDFYPSTDFEGCTLFQYAIGTGADDIVLGFPIKYSSFNNLGDISFEVSLNTQTFNYDSSGISVTEVVNSGYVYDYSTRTDYVRNVGWETAPGESFQYQVFEKTYNATPISPEFTLDVAIKDQTTTPWPVIVVYVDNARISNSSFAVITTDTTTTVTLSTPPLMGTKVVIMLYSDQTSITGYYQIPSNLDHNPFNSEVTTINSGDIRGHYKSICNNAPGFEGLAFGANNYRDIGNVVPYGMRIIQNSASLVNASAFLRNNSNNFFDALSYNANEYIKFKNLLINTLVNNEYTSLQTSAYILDDVMSKISEVRINTNPFFWSDMLPSKNATVTNTYTFKTDISTSIFNLSRIYNFTEANYYSVLVYLTRRIGRAITTTQLIRGVDYVVSETEKNLTITKDLINNDVIVIKEYDQTYGSFVPNTPTKLGLYPATIPSIILDSTYIPDTYFIKGHDGSYNKLYGKYENGALTDYRDSVLLEFETRIFNNLKISAKIPINYDEIVPGEFRDVGISYENFRNMYSTQFLNWIGQNRIDYKEHLFSSTNPFTFNYNKSVYKNSKKVITQGSWRGIYLWFYDTTNPALAPWEMLGLTDKPTWWDSRYGIAPYTSENTYMWTDISNGYIWNDGDPYVNENRIRPDLLNIIPVDSNGNLLSPFDFLLNAYNSNDFDNPWTVGDVGPAEFSYLRSSTWPFDLMRLAALLKPAKFFALGIDVDKYKFNTEFNQYLYNNRYRDSISNLVVYGAGTSVHSYINWLVDYLYQFGIDGSTSITTLIKNLDVRLSYRLAGFSDKDLLNFYVEKGTPNSKNNSLLIPDDSYSVLLYDNQPSDTIVYSSVIVQKTQTGYKVFGNSQNRTYFTAQIPITNGLYDTFTIDGLSVQVPKNYYPRTILIPYGHEFNTITELCEFIRGHGLYLTSQGLQFTDIENGIELTWDQMILEMLYWVKTGWDYGSSINVNPNARNIFVSKENNIVQPLTIQRENFVLNQNLLPIATSDLFINRNGVDFNIKSLNEGDSMSFFRANLSSMEHVVVFDNVTVFNDVIYNLITGLRQQRIYVKGSKSAEWNGLVNASGYIINQDNIELWQENVKYTKGTIVRFKNDYYIAENIVILPSATFDYTQWSKTSYDDIQKGLLPNPSTRAYEATMFYDTTNPNLENDNDLLSASLIGFRPRTYFADANFSDATQVNLYKNMIPVKGTVDSVTKLQGINLQQNSLNYEVHENWAIKASEFGGLLNQNFIEVTLNEAELTGNPSIISIVQDDPVIGAEQSVPLYKIKNYGRPIASTNILPTLDYTYQEKLPSAGYVNIDDVTEIAYSIGTLADSSIGSIYKNEYIWVAEKDNTWQIYTPVSTGALVVNVINNLNDTVTVVFNKPHGLLKNQSIGILNFDSLINGFHTINEVINLTSLVVSTTLTPSTTSISGKGLSYLLQSQRVITARDIDALPLLNAEYSVNKVWVDANTNGTWTVYEKTNNYPTPGTQISHIGSNTTFGTAVAHIPNVGYFVSDLGEGKLYHYAISSSGFFYLRNTIDEGGNFGTSITRSNDLIIVSSPDDILSQIFVYRIPPATNINSIILEQVISIFGGRVGDAMDISGDSNILYLGAKNDNTALAFQRDKTLTYTSSGLVLGAATLLDKTYFVCSGNCLSPNPTLLEGQRVNFVTSYTSIGSTISSTVSAGDYYFVCTGDQRSDLANGDKVTFTNNGPASTRLYTIASEAYDPGSNTTTFYTVEMADATVNVGQTVYKITFSEEAVYTVITATYNSTTNKTTFYVIEPIQYSAPSASYVYIASVNFSLVGSISPPMVAAGDQFSYSLATNYDGSKLFAGAPYTDYSLSLPNTGIAYMYDRLVENIEVQYDQRPDEFYIIILAFNPTNQTRIYINGVLLATNKYVVILNFVIIGTIGMYAGDIVTISSAQFVLTQQIYGYDNLNELRPGELFGYSVDCNTFGSEVIIGSPFDVTDSLKEGAVYRFTNGGKRFGIMTGLIATNVTSPFYILINGYRVTIPAGNAATVANAINSFNITNTFAYSTQDGRLVIRLRDINLGPINNKLNIGVFNGNDLYELGFTDYIKSQVIQDPHLQTRTQFGYAVKFNDENSFVISAPANDRYISTTFDFSNDNNIKNDTVFDNNLTTFQDVSSNAGSVYMYDYIQSYDESLLNIGKYIYAQSCNDIAMDYGAQPMYGTALAFNDNIVMVGTPNFKPLTTKGKVLVFTNESGIPNWHSYRESDPIVDVEKIQKVSLYNNTNNENLIGLDYVDPLQGKLLGTVAEHLDYISSTDPAGYNGPQLRVGNIVWTKDHLGKLWFNTTTTRFMNYHQDDVVYNSKYWGTVFPGSTVTVYSWIESDVSPAFYTGPGVPYDIGTYSVTLVTDSNNNLIPKYYFWVRNTNRLFSLQGKTLSDSILERYIADPKNSGIAFFAPLKQNTYAFYNAQEYVNDVSTNLHLGYGNSANGPSGHLEFELIRSEYPSDFLSGFPNRDKGYNDPVGLYDRLLDSMSGTDETGATVPDPTLPKLLQIGVSVRPRQSLFINRLEALRNYLEYANSVIALYPILEFGNTTFLVAQGDTFNTTNYWEKIYWWAEGYSDSTRAALDVAIYTDLLTLTEATEGLIVGVASNSQGNREVYIYTDSTWVRIGVQNGTLKFLPTLWNYQKYKTGFGDSFSGESFDFFPSAETRYIVRALNEQIYVGPLFEHRNKSLILLFEYIQSENIESQNYLPWLTKTSFADVNYSVRELTTNQKFQRDNQSLLEGYINEFKPYHVVVKEFYLQYNKTDVFEGDFTDYDLPAFYNSEIGRFVSPQLLYGLSSPPDDTTPVYASYPDEFPEDSPIWSSAEYSQWFASYGTLIKNIPNTPICNLAKFMSSVDIEIYIDDAAGIPVAGTVQIEDEIIGYTVVDRVHKILSGISRGVNNTVPVDHYAGIPIIMDLPGIVVLDSGSQYADTPTVTAYVDTTIYPAPKREAKLVALMSDDKVIGVDIIDSGEGYVVIPEIVFSSSYEETSEFFRINFVDNTIQLLSTNFVTGQLVYSQGISTNGVNMIPDGYYYINSTQISALLFAFTGNASLVSFYKTYDDSIYGTNRVQFTNETLMSNDYTHTVSIRARAIPTMNSSKVRTMATTLKFDRTSYRARIKPWVAGEYYSSPYLSIGNDASSPVKLQVAQPTSVITSAYYSGGSGTNASFRVYNVLLGGTYDADVINPGANYVVGDVIRIIPNVISALSPLFGYPSTAQLAGSIVKDATIINMASTTGITVGDYITGYGIPYDTVVLSIDINTNIIISNPATETDTTLLLFLTGYIPNDCLITVESIGAGGEISTISIAGTAIDANLSSLQGAVLPINTLSDVNGQAIVNVTYTLGLLPGQVYGGNMYFYRVHSGYTYDDTGKNFTASITGTTMTVTAIEDGSSLVVGDSVYGINVPSGTVISAFLSASGGTGTYTVNTSSGIVTASINATTLTVTGVTAGTLKNNQVISGSGVTAGTYIVSQISGSLGGIGTYTVSTTQSVASTTITATITASGFNTSGGAIIKIYRPRFNPKIIDNLYYIKILNSGYIYSVGDVIVIAGSLLGGVDIINDAKIVVGLTVNGGSIFSANVNGIAVGEFGQYFVKPTSDNELAIYADALLTVPVSYSSFIWDGSGEDYAYLPEPIGSSYAYGYDISSVVSYAGVIWQCIEANNDTEFTPTHWYPLLSSDSALNALDRIEAYYEPTVGMPGKDAQQLVKGISYPNNVYYGNAFAPEDELPLDFIVRDEPFYPTGVNVKAVVYNGTTIVAACDATDHSLVLVYNETGTWNSYKIASVSLGITDIAYNSDDDVYVITSTNELMPVLVSFDAVLWVTLGQFTAFDSIEFGAGGFDSTEISAPNVPMNSVLYVNGIYFSAGNTILRSTDALAWTQVYAFASRLTNTINDIAYIDIPAFTGYIGVGLGYQVISGQGTSSPTISEVSRVVTSINGTTVWDLQPTLDTVGFNGVAASSTLVAVVGDEATVWYSNNTNNWVQGTISGPAVTANLNSVARGGSLFVAVGDKIGSSSTDIALIIYSSNGITWTQATGGSVPTRNLNSVYYSGGYFYAVGEENVILRSNNGINWVDLSNLQVDDPYYVVQGNDFLYGYGPEELVAGVVTDTLSMYVNTAPGAYWNLGNDGSIWYKHTGFNMVSTVTKPNLNLEITFANVVVNPTRMSVFIIDDVTNDSYRIYENTTTGTFTYTYSIDWYNQIVTINQSLPAGKSIMIEMYEVGNGKELIRSNSKYTPIRVDEDTGWSCFIFDIQYEEIVNDPLVYVSVAGGTLNKLEYNVDYIISYTYTNFMKLLFLNTTLDPNTDYVSFSIVGNSRTDYNLTQYGYSIPETQVFLGSDIVPVNGFALDDSLTTLTGDNIDNSIVEVNGQRLIPPNLTGAEYTFASVSGTNYLQITATPASTDVIAITTFYDTERQFLTTADYTGGTGINVTAISYVDHSKTPMEVTFTSDPGFVDTDIIRIDDVSGTTGINNMTYYVDKISATLYNLYTDIGLTTPVVGPDFGGYTGGGYAWLDSSTIQIPTPATPGHMEPPILPDMTYTDGSRTWFTINGQRLNPQHLRFSTSASFTGSISGTTLTVTAIASGLLNIGQEIFGSSISPNTYIVGMISGVGGIGTYEVDISQTVASSAMTTSVDNKLSIFANLDTTDLLLVTSMVTGASPNSMSFNYSINKYSEASVYRANPQDGSWLTQEFELNDDTMYFYNVSNLVETFTTSVNVVTVGLNTYARVQCDINEIKEVLVYNVTVGQNIDSTNYGITLLDGKPTVLFTGGVTAGDLVRITLTVGNIVEIEGERIKFDYIDTVNNTITGLTRGIQGTSSARTHSQYAIGYGINNARKLSEAGYNSTWNSENIVTYGDPLQISDTTYAKFLQSRN